LVVLAYLVILFFTWGFNEAQNRRVFFTVQPSNRVVLATYGRMIVTANPPGPDRQLDGSFQLMWMGEDLIDLKPREIGPLRPRD
jgi:hypothetical protein